MALTIKKREKLSVESTPVEWRTFQDDVKFELYSIAHPLYLQAVNAQEQRSNKRDLLDLSEEENDLEMQIKIVGRYLVKDWQGLLDEDGEPLAVNVDNFVDVVLSNQELFAWVIDQCADIAKQNAEALNKTKKKSLNATTGKKNMAVYTHRTKKLLQIHIK